MEDVRARIWALAEERFPTTRAGLRSFRTRARKTGSFREILPASGRRRGSAGRCFFRGIIEFTNYCKNDCYYCGIRRSNRELSRYRLTEDEILTCCEEGYKLGYRTFVLQGGEDGWWTDEKITALVRKIRAAYPDCAITLSIGEKIAAGVSGVF